MHYDMYTNSYVQLRGRKTFYLSPPESHDLLHLRPALHPAHRSSQLGDVVKHFASLESNYRERESHQPAIYKVTLQPGDVLYIPALWFHQVQAETFSLSINMWTEYYGVASVAEELNHLALPTSDNWMDEEQVQIYRVYILLSLLNSSIKFKGMEDLPKNAPENDRMAHIIARLRVLHLEQRYADVGMVGAESKYCLDSVALGRALRLGGYELLLLQESIKKAAGLLATLQERTTLGRFEMYVANWVEHVVCNAVGVRQVHQFLSDLLSC